MDNTMDTPSVLILPFPFQTVITYSSVRRVLSGIWNVIGSFPIGNAQNVFLKCNILTTPFRTRDTLIFSVPPVPWLPGSGLPYLSGKSVHMESGVSWGHLPFGMLKTFSVSVTI